MPQPTSGVQTVGRNAGAITFTDWEGKSLSQSIPTAGGSTTMGAVQDLAEAIADVSNACFSELRNNETKKWKDGDLRVFDDAQASCAQVIVLIFPHDTDPDKNHEVLIPAYDAQYVLSGGAVDLLNADIQNVVDKALDILNDDDNALNPDNYHAENVYAFTSTRKTNGRKGVRVRSIPILEEPDGDAPDDAPGDLP